MKRFAQGDSPPNGGKLYRKTAVVRMWRMDEPFECESKEGVMTGDANDLLVEDGYGGYYPCGHNFHAENYEEVRE